MKTSQELAAEITESLAVERAAFRFVQMRARNPSEVRAELEYFRRNWRRLPGLKARVLAEMKGPL